MSCLHESFLFKVEGRSGEGERKGERQGGSDVPLDLLHCAHSLCQSKSVVTEGELKASR